MERLDIAARIWLSFGILVLGHVTSAKLRPNPGTEDGSHSATTADPLFPAVQGAQDAVQKGRQVVGEMNAVRAQFHLVRPGLGLLTAIVVNLTIRRSIRGPITHLIQGVEQANNSAIEASDRMRDSGSRVSRALADPPPAATPPEIPGTQ